MRRYCQNVDITDIEFIECCIYLWMENKKSRRDVQRFFAHYTTFTYQQIRKMARIGEWDWLSECVHKISEDVQKRLIKEKLDLPPIEFKDKYDDVCGKWRRIGIQKPIHQIFDYIAVEACKNMFMAKIGPYQMASIKGRGQERGAKQIKKWIQFDKKNCRYWVKGDVRKCYPSIPHDKIKSLFTRDVKNKKLLWLTHELIDSFPDGLSIGSYFSQFACNYYLSQAYRHVSELRKARRKKSGEILSVRLVHHQIWFMDDVLLLGSSIKDLEQAMRMLTDYMEHYLGLTIKPAWRAYETDHVGPDGEHRGRDIDMMGYRIYCDHLAIRRRTFKRHRRALLRVKAKIGRGEKLTLAEARKVMSFKGKFKHSNSFGIRKSLKLDKVSAKARAVISAYDRARQDKINDERRQWDDYKSTCCGETAGNPVHGPFGWLFRCLDQKKYHQAKIGFG
jgi:hypothetical protein